MEVETMLEDDVFFAELSKRISLLITDDDEGGADFAAAAQFVPASSAAAPLPHMGAIAHNLTKRRDRSFRSPNRKRSKNNSIMGKKKQGISIMLV